MDDQTKLKIEKENEKILNEIDLKEPPLLVEDVLQHLELYRGYYNLEDPKLLQHFWHEVEIKKNKFFKLVREKAKLVAMWFPKESQILIDNDLPKPKKKWATHQS